MSATFLSTGAILLANLLIGVFIARALGPAGRGEVTAALLWPGILALVGTGGLIEAATYFIASRTTRWDIREVVTTDAALILAVSTAAALVGIAAVPLLLANQRDEVVHLSQALLVAMPISQLGPLAANVLWGRRQYVAAGVFQILPKALVLGAVCLLTLTGDVTVGLVVATYIAGPILTAGVAGGFLRRFVGRRAFRRPLVRPIARFGSRAWVTALSAAANARADQLVIAALLSPVSLGWYAVAVNVCAPLTAVANAAGTVTLPETAATAEQIRDRTIARNVKLILVLGVPCVVILIAVAGVLVPFVFGNDFRPSVPLVRIIALGMVFLSVERVMIGALLGLNRPGGAALAEIAGLLVTALGLGILLGPFGITGAAVTSVAAYFAMSVVAGFFLIRATELGWRALFIPNAEDVSLVTTRAKQLFERRRS